jgi:prolipoprotein diacylglyceryltransferase
MPDVVQIGPLQLQGTLVALLLACLLGYWLMRRAAQQLHRSNLIEPASTDRLDTNGVEDLILNSVLIVFFTWRLGRLLTEPSLLWTSPMKLLLTAGSNMEIVLGLVLAFVYLSYQVRKRNMAWRPLLDIFAIGAASAVFLAMALTPTFGLPTTLPWGIGVEGTVSRFHPDHAYLAILLLPLLLWQQVSEARSTSIGQGKLLKFTLFYGGTAGMIASYFSQVEPTLIYLSTQQLLFLLMMVIGMNLPVLSHTTGRRELIDMSKNDSKTQIQQEQQNQERTKTPATKEGYDKKLDGPNRPST